MKTAISIPNPLFKTAEKLSQRLHMSRSRLYALALLEFLAKHKEDRVTEKLDAVYATEFSCLDSIVADAQRRKFKNDTW